MRRYGAENGRARSVGHYPSDQGDRTVTEILVRRKNCSRRPKFQEKWSTRTIFPRKVCSGLGIMVRVRLIAIVVYEKDTVQCCVVSSIREPRYVTRKEKQSPEVAVFCETNQGYALFGALALALSQERTSQPVRERLQTGTRTCGGAVDKKKTSIHVLNVPLTVFPDQTRTKFP